MKKRVLAIMLACLMLVSLLPVGSLAAGVQNTCPGTGKNHNLTNCTATKVDAVVPECGTEDYGYDIYSCDVCGDLFAANFYKGDKNEKHDYEIVKDEDGYCDKEVCTKCGHEVEAHEWDKATCTEPKTCVICGKTEDKALGHTWSKEPTSIKVEPNEQTFESGIAIYTCTVCKATKEVEILAHDCEDFLTEEYWVEAKEASCTENGTIGHFDCPKCDRLYAYNEEGELVQVTKADLVTEMASHTIPMEDIYGWGEDWLFPVYTDVDGDGIYKVDPDCKNAGYVEYICAVCEEEVKEILPVVHDWREEQHVDPSCDSFGYTLFVCYLCGESKFEVHQPTGHSERPEDAYYYEATCTENAFYEWYCTKCNWYATEEVPGTALGHDPKIVTVPATCGEYGYTYTYCARENKYGYCCDDAMKWGWEISTEIVTKDEDGNEVKETYTIRISDTEYLPLLGYKIFVSEGFSKTNHVEPDDAVAVYKPATCTENGLKAFWCASCAESVVEVIPALGHTKADKTTIVPATCQAPGYEAYLCTVCGKPVEVVRVLTHTNKVIYDSYEEIAAIHVDEDGNCTLEPTGDWTPTENYKGCPTIGMKRWECTECKDVMLVAGAHKAPADLPARKVVMTFSSEDNWGYHNIENPMFGYEATVTYEVIADGLVEGEDYSITYGSPNGEVPADLEYFMVYISAWAGEVVVVATFTPTEYWAASAPTCTENGWTAQFVCTECDAPVMGETYIPAVLDEDGKVVTEAVRPDLAALGHENYTKPVAPDCTNTGLTEGYDCSICGEKKVPEVVEALGHELESKGEFVVVGEFSGELFACTREGCGYEVIKNFVSVCEHEWILDRKLSSTSTCTKNGYDVYVCVNCGTVSAIELPLADHVNEDGEVLCPCEKELPEDNVCVNCEKEIVATGAHTFLPVDDTVLGKLGYLYYPQTCISEEYYIRECEYCDHYDVIKIQDPAGHKWVVTTAVPDKDGNIVGFVEVCEVCGAKNVKSTDTITFTFDIVNAANGDGEITDGSLVKVVVSISGTNDAVWGFKFNVPYSENMTLIKSNYCVNISDEFAVYANANKDTDGNKWVTIAGNANSAADVVVDGTVVLCELYFVVNQKAAGEVSVDVNTGEVLNYKGEELQFLAKGETVKTVELMELDGKAGISMQDILAAYKLIVDGKYAAAADIDKDGKLEMDDLQAMYKYLIGAKKYSETRATGIAKT